MIELLYNQLIILAGYGALLALAILFVLFTLRGVLELTDQAREIAKTGLLDLVQVISAANQSSIDTNRAKHQLDHDRRHSDIALAAKSNELWLAKRQAEMQVLNSFDATEMARAQAGLMIRAQRDAIRRGEK